MKVLNIVQEDRPGLLAEVTNLVEAPVALLSTSPDRQDTILLRDPFAD